MTYLTKMQERKRFIAEFARRLREARPGERVYMRVGDVFKDADIYSLDEWRAARWAAVFGDDDGRAPPQYCGGKSRINSTEERA